MLSLESVFQYLFKLSGSNGKVMSTCPGLNLVQAISSCPDITDKPEERSSMRELVGACRSGNFFYSISVKPGFSTASACIVELDSDVYLSWVKCSSSLVDIKIGHNQ